MFRSSPSLIVLILLSASGASAQTLRMLEEFPSEKYSEADEVERVAGGFAEDAIADPVKEVLTDEESQHNYAMIFAGEASPWVGYGVQFCAAVPEGYKPNWAPTFGFLIVGSGKFRQAALKHDGEELNLHVAANSAALGFFTPMSRLIALRYGVGLASFTGNFTQRGTDIFTEPDAGDLLGSGFAGNLLYTTLAGVIGWQNDTYRIEFVPVGFRIPIWSRFKHDTTTPHEAAVNRHLSSAGIFGLVNLGIGMFF